MLFLLLASAALTPHGGADRVGIGWGDFDGDGLSDAFVVAPDGGGVLLRNAGDGSFEDVTVASGLGGLGAPTVVAWRDFDADRRPDLLVGTRSGVQLFRNEGGTAFRDVTSELGISVVGSVVHADWIDYDRDGRLDLHVATPDTEALYHNVDGESFEAIDLASGFVSVLPTAVVPALAPTEGALERPATPEANDRGRTGSRSDLSRDGNGGDSATGPPGGSGFETTGAQDPGPPPAVACVDSIVDSAGGTCIAASSVPQIGRLYPLSTDFNLDASGRVGIGHTSPVARLHAKDATELAAVFGESTAVGGRGVYGTGNGPGASDGVHGATISVSGSGVRGLAAAASGESTGVRGTAVSDAGRGVVGEATSTSGGSIGVLGTSVSLSGTGVRGTSPNVGVGGTSDSVGVSGEATNDTSFGMYGRTTGTFAAGVTGVARATSVNFFLPDTGVGGINTSPDGSAVAGVNGATSGDAVGVSGLSNSTAGIGVRGTGFYGVRGISEVDGTVTGSGAGIRGEFSGSATLGFGVFGTSSSTLGVGVLGAVDDLTAIFGDSGVSGANASTNGSGVGGLNNASSGYAPGVVGQSNSTQGFGVWGVTTSSRGHGVVGANQSSAFGSVGVWATTASTFGAGVVGFRDADGGINDAPYPFFIGGGVSGASDENGVGVIGSAWSSDGFGLGVSGISNAEFGIGVRGESAGSTGSGTGVFGTAIEGTGVHGTAFASTGIGVHGENSAGFGALAVFSEGNFLVSGGSKSFVHPHPSDPSKEIRYVCLEGNESGTYFRGSAELVDGRAVIDVPEDFRFVTEEEGLTVQLTALGRGALWVESKGLEQIVVRGERDVAFDYFVNGVRHGFSDFDPVHGAFAYVPRKRGVPFGRGFAPAIRERLVANGTLRSDYTPNEATASALGWPLRERAPELLRAQFERARVSTPPKTPKQVELPQRKASTSRAKGPTRMPEPEHAARRERAAPAASPEVAGSGRRAFESGRDGQ